MEKKFKSVLLIGIFAHVNYVSAQNTYINRGDSIKNIMLENIVVESKIFCIIRMERHIFPK